MLCASVDAETQTDRFDRAGRGRVSPNHLLRVDGSECFVHLHGEIVRKRICKPRTAAIQQHADIHGQRSIGGDMNDWLGYEHDLSDTFIELPGWIACTVDELWDF